MPSIRYPLTDAKGFEFQAPKAVIPLPLYNDAGRVRTAPFLFDTGAAVSLVPVPLARLFGLLGPGGRADPLDPDDAPVTLRGRLTGRRGEFRTRMLGQHLAVPCYFYEPPALDGRQSPPEDVAEWADAVRGFWSESATPAAMRRAPCVLGRLGFLSRFAVTVDGRDRSRQVVVSDDPGRPAPAGPERLY